MPLISVIVPVYRVEDYLRACVDSILAQTFTDFELWLVDDGSPDACPSICDACAAADSRVQVIHQANGGLSAARNAGLDRATGQYLCFVDSDDYLAPDALETLYTALIDADADIAVGNMMSVDVDGRCSEFYCPAAQRTVLEGEALLSTLSQPCAQNRIYKAEIFRTLRYPVGRLYEDVFIYHHILAQTKRMVLTGQTDYYYRLRANSIMRMAYHPRFTDIVFAIRDRYTWLDAIGQPALADQARLFVYSRVAVAYAHLDAKDPAQRAKLDEITAIFLECYPVLMCSQTVSRKQKFRLWLLKTQPALHTRLFGKRMPLALG